MRSYIDSDKNKLSFILDDNADNYKSFEQAKKIIEMKYPELQPLEYQPPFWNTGKFKFLLNGIELELFFSDYFGGTELLVNKDAPKSDLDKVHLLAIEIYNPALVRVLTNQEYKIKHGKEHYRCS